MTDIAYSDRFDPYNSSVIRTVFYNETEQLLFVLLRRDDILCGYRHVPRSVYTSMLITNDNGNSVGSYWNTWVKDHYEGFNTDGVHLVEEGDEPLYSTLHGAEEVHLTGVKQADPQDAPEVDAEAYEFAISFVFSVDEKPEALNIIGLSVADALDKFNQIVALAGWDAPAVVAITQFFDV